MDIQVVTDKVLLDDLRKLVDQQFGDLVKAVVDIQQDIMAIGGELHADEEAVLLEKKGSKQEDLWGINLYPNKFGSDDFIEFDSMINIRPRQNNRSRSVENPKIQEQIVKVVKSLVNE